MLPLVHEVQAAYECQLYEQRESTARFLNRIAALCERSDCSASGLAAALRELDDAGKEGFSNLRNIASKNDENKAADNKHTVLEATVSHSACEDYLALESIDVDPHTPNDSQCVASVATFEGLDRKSMEELRHSFEIPKCTFIQPDGEIQRPPSDFEALVGPCLHRVYKALSYSWCMPSENGFYFRLVRSMPFKVIGALVILANFFFIICQSDYRIWSEINQHSDKEAEWMRVAEIVFTGYYMCELMCLIIAHRKDFFLGPDMAWNLFDFVIVLTGALELIMTSLGGSMKNLSFLRVLRFFKMSRVLRTFSALRMVKDVKIMVDALTGSFVIFVFGCLLLAMFLSVFSIFFVQGMTTFLEAEASIDPMIRASIIEDFGSVATSMRSLFMSVTGGDDWSRFYTTVKILGPVYDYLYLFFMAFALIAFCNVITGVFAEKAMSLASPTTEDMARKRKGREIKDAQELVGVLNRVLKKGGTEGISAAAFHDLMSHPEIVSFFEVRGLKATTAHRFFVQLLEINQTDRLDVGAFVSACVKLDGAASSIDLHVLSVEMRTVLMQQHMMQEMLNDNFKFIAKSSEMPSVAPKCPAHSAPCPPAASAPALTTTSGSQPAPIPSVVLVPTPREKSSLPCLLSGRQESGHNVLVEPADDNVTSDIVDASRSSNAKLARSRGDECPDALLSSCCKGVKDQEEAMSVASTNLGSVESGHQNCLSDSPRHFVL